MVLKSQPCMRRYYDSDGDMRNVESWLRIYMELGPDGGLHSCRRRVLGWTHRQRLKIALQIAEALHYLHSQHPSLVHLDVKP